MQKLHLLLATLLLPLAFIACGGAPTHESLAADADKEAGKVVKILEGITDAESAKAAKDKLIKAIEKVREIYEQRSELEEIDPELDKKLTEKYMSKDSNLGKMTAQMARVGMLPGAQETMQEVGNALKGLDQ